MLTSILDVNKDVDVNLHSIAIFYLNSICSVDLNIKERLNTCPLCNVTYTKSSMGSVTQEMCEGRVVASEGGDTYYKKYDLMVTIN